MVSILVQTARKLWQQNIRTIIFYKVGGITQKGHLPPPQLNTHHNHAGAGISRGGGGGGGGGWQGKLMNFPQAFPIISHKE